MVKRARKVVSCQPCRASKLKCDRNRPCVRTQSVRSIYHTLDTNIFEQSSCELRGPPLSLIHDLSH
jgi:hypothetical protein